ncbi:two pore domain potassium channel family protein [Pseudonocardia sp. K10HN5]|uniref:Two pore domain potassium channel family protein n=1 Tax=Pseudonocardia acidicola TaxID=2724939 RepID=A0ABX1S9Z2_9PSEU|nr:two pore domain potassium channel family protein [Pseudonocardia acidicola]
MRSTLTVAALITVYYLVPLTRRATPVTLLQLLGGLVAITVFATWQVRSIVRSPYPAMRAIETLAAAVPLYLLLFAAFYYMLADSQPLSFTQPVGRTDALYFTMTVFSTVGFGDIAPVTPVARVVVTVQMVTNLLVIGVLLRAVLGAVRLGRSRRDADRPDDGPVGRGG